MNESKFTKGPWKAGKNPYMTTVLDGHEGKAIYQDDENNPHHLAWANAENADGDLDMETALANASLIAAAPEMYEMLKSLLDDCEICTACAHYPGEITPRQQIEAVLKKARGEA